MKFSAQLASLNDLRQIIIPPSMVCVAPTTITATWFLTEDMPLAGKVTLAKMLGLEYGEYDGCRVSFHPTVAYSIEDVILLSKATDILPYAMGGPCRNIDSVMLREKNALYNRLPDISRGALISIIELPALNYPKDWMNEKITSKDFKAQLFRATRECPNAFMWVERYGSVWVGTKTALDWWNQRYGVRLTFKDMNALLGKSTQMQVDGLKNKYAQVMLDIRH